MRKGGSQGGVGSQGPSLLLPHTGCSFSLSRGWGDWRVSCRHYRVLQETNLGQLLLAMLVLPSQAALGPA